MPQDREEDGAIEGAEKIEYVCWPKIAGRRKVGGGPKQEGERENAD